MTLNEYSTYLLSTQDFLENLKFRIDFVCPHFLSREMEVGDGESSGGRRPKLLRFNFSSGCIIGVDVGGTNISGVVTNLKG
ncbi:hypothetical protein HKBW3S42_02527, partial [Candidatus Hakubella thermalkaliphila]